MEHRQRRMVATAILATSFFIVLYLLLFSPTETSIDLPTNTPASASLQGMPTQLPVRPATDEKQATEAARSSQELTPDADRSTASASPVAREIAPIPDWMNRVASIPQNSVCPDDAVRMVDVSTADQLHTALANAQAGDRITLADGRYVGSFTASIAGGQAKRIWICGSPAAIIDGGDWNQGVALQITSDYIGVWGITISNAKQGVLVDGGNFVQIDNVEITTIGEEGIRFRANAADGIIQDTRIHDTGLFHGEAGSGIVVGSAVSEWSQVSDNAADHTDRIHIARNRIWGTAAEAIRIHPGTKDGVLEFNSFDGAATTAATAWVDILGTGFTIRGNVGVTAPEDGFQVHSIDGISSGNHNRFISNTAQISGADYGFFIQNPETTQNTIACNNFVTNAAVGFANIPCTDTVT